jgi:hypothetical protein
VLLAPFVIDSSDVILTHAVSAMMIVSHVMPQVKIVSRVVAIFHPHSAFQQVYFFFIFFKVELKILI